MPRATDRQTRFNRCARTLAALAAILLVAGIVARPVLAQGDARSARRDPAIEKARTLVPEAVGRIAVADVDDFKDLPATTREQIRGLAAFRLYRNGSIDPTIYISRSSWYYTKALDVPGVVYLLASSIVHELTHGDGGDEAAAIKAELQFLDRWITTTIGSDERRLLKAQYALKQKQLAKITVRPTDASVASDIGR